MSRVLRAIEPRDIPALLALRVSTRENVVTYEELEQDYDVTPDSLLASLGDPVRGWLCEQNGCCLGFSMGHAGTGEVLVVAVRPQAEDTGVGRAVLERVCDWLFGEGHARLWLLTPPDPSLRAPGFYAHLGWRDSGERRNGEAVLVLARPA